jgi:signal transduction histidine kinase
MKFTLDELRPLAILDGLSDKSLNWLADNGDRIELAAGDRMFSRGESAEFMFIVVSGTIQRYEEVAGQWLVVSTSNIGQVTGMLPFSRMTHYPGHTVATEPSLILRVNKSDFDEMLAVSHELGQALVAEMSNRVRGDVRLEQQREKMMALGRLSAGLAHELNNPTAAIRRTSESLAESLESQSKIILAMLQQDHPQVSIVAMDKLWKVISEKEIGDSLSPLDRSDREEEFADWLAERDITEAWEYAGVFTDTGLLVEDLDRFCKTVPSEFLNDAFAWITSNIEINRMVDEISASAGRVSELVSSVKVYSHMDRSSEHKPTNVQEGLDSTLRMFGHRLKEKNIQLIREYKANLPTIPANAGELNQIWTNLIDNALDAMEKGGELRVRITTDDWGLIVRIIDNGAGIPEDVRARIFDPFFTTKDVGEGTGLGLDISRRIVNTHGGQIEVKSKPGQTEMYVRLPIAPEKNIG